MPPRIVYVFTSSLALRFLRGQFGFLREAGYDVVIVASPSQDLTDVAREEGAQVVRVPTAREISPAQDLVSLWRLWRAIRRLRPWITNVGTPKAGFLGGLAAWLAGVPYRVYTLYGLRLETTGGLRRRVLMFAEWVACLCAHRVICVSESLRQEAVGLGLAKPERTTVFSPGSCNGVDISRFEFDGGSGRPRSRLREELGIPRGAPAIGFVGRFTRDKGVAELIDAFASLRSEFPELRLLMVGDFEEGDRPTAEVVKQIQTDPNVVCTGFVDDTAPYYDAMDILALPTYREGFPNVVLEAQAAGKPAVVTDATGAADSVVDGVTGMIVPTRDSRALGEALAKLLRDPALASAMGENGRKRVVAEFQPARIWSELTRLYQSSLEEKGLPVPVASLQRAESVRRS